MQVFELVGRIVLEGKEKLTSDMKVITEEAKRTNAEFRSFVQGARSIGMSFVGIGAAGLLAAKATENWNNALGDTLQTLKPVFVVMTAIGGILLTLPSIIRGVVVAFNVMRAGLKLLQAQAIATQAAFGLLTLGLSMIAYGVTMLVTHGRHVKEVTAETERWGDTLGRTNDRLHDLILAGEGASAEAEELRRVMDDLIATYDIYNTIGEDNVVTIYNQADAEAKLAEYKEILLILEDKLIGRQTAENRATAIGIQQTENLEASIGNYKNTIAELTLGLIELQAAQEDEADTIRDNAIKALEEDYGLRANASISLMQQFEDETKARQDSLNDQLDAVRDNTNDIIKQYQREYNAKVKLLNDETDAQVKALQDQLDLLDDSQEAADEAAEDTADAKTEAELRLAVSQAWNRKDRATAETALATFLEDKAAKLADRVRQDQRDSLQQQIQDVQSSAQIKRDEYQAELDAKTEVENAKLEASEITIQSELDSLANALITKRGILQQELNDAVTVHNQIRDNAIAGINAVISAQLSAANISSVPLSAQGAIHMQSGIDYENWAASTGGGARRYASGGPILEPTLLSSLRTGRPYAIAGENGPERVVPGGGGITITGNTFNVRSDADIPRIASELLRQRMLKGSFGS